MNTDEAGFSLVELVIVIAILPIVIGGIAAALLSVLGLQNSVSQRVGNSNDALVSSANFNKDVQSAQQIENLTTPACGASTQTQVLGLEWGQDVNGTYHNVVSYVLNPLSTTNPPGTTTQLLRQICNSGASATPDSTFTVANDVNTPTVTYNPTGFLSSNPLSGWKSTQGLFGVTLNITGGSSSGAKGQFSYSLSGLPGASASTGSVSQLVQAPNPAGCNLASPGSGTYANVLCFADFSSFTDPSGACQQMRLSIANSPDYLQFCVIATPQNSIRPNVLPTYYNPGTGQGQYNSEAYLGNNGFYTGVQGEPALYQQVNAGLSTITFTNIQVTNAVGQPATGWTLVAGDAESTDTNGWLVFQNSNVNWSILPNTSTSLWGNSCFNSASPNNNGAFQWTGPIPPSTTDVGTPTNGPPPAQNATPLTVGPAPGYATGASAILCEGDSQLNKTGTMMVAAPEPSGSSAPQNVSITLKGEGIQAIFLAVLL